MQQFTILETTAPEAALGNVEALHDLRIALRRSRTLLRAGREYLRQGQRLADALGEINRKLGPLRDLDTWITFLERTGKKHPRLAATTGTLLIQRAVERRNCELPKAQRLLRSRQFNAAKKSFERLIADIPQKDRTTTKAAFEEVAAKWLRRRIRKARVNQDWHTKEDRKTVHRARNRFRQVRYLAEHFAPTLGISARRAAQQLRAVEQELGRAHDMDCATQFLLTAATPPKRLLRLIARRRSKALRRARETAQQSDWPKLEARLKCQEKEFRRFPKKAKR